MLLIASVETGTQSVFLLWVNPIELNGNYYNLVSVSQGVEGGCLIPDVFDAVIRDGWESH